MTKLVINQNSFSDTLIPRLYINNIYLALETYKQFQSSERKTYEISFEMVAYLPTGYASNPLLNFGVYLFYQKELVDEILKGKSFYEKTFKKMIYTETSTLSNTKSSTIKNTTMNEQPNLFLKNDNRLGPIFRSYSASRYLYRDQTKDIENIKEKAYSTQIIIENNVVPYNLHVVTFFYLNDNNSIITPTNILPPVGDVILGPINMEKITNTSDVVRSNFANLLANNVERFLLVDNAEKETNLSPPSALLGTVANNETINVWAGAYHIHKKDRKDKIMAGLVHTQNKHPILSKAKVVSGINKISFVESFDIVEDQINNIRDYITPSRGRDVKRPEQDIMQISFTSPGTDKIAEKILELSNISTLNRQVEFPRSNRSALVDTVGNFSNNYQDPVANDITTKITNKQIQPSPFGSQNSMANTLQTNTGLLRSGKRGFTFEVKKSQPIKNNSEIYTSLIEDGSVGTIFAIDKINILKNFSGFSKILDFTSPKIIKKILDRTTLSKISIERVSKYNGTSVREAVIDKAFGLNDTSEINIKFQTDRFFKSKDKNDSCVFQTYKNINVQDKDRIIFCSLLDYRKDSTIKENFKYEYELEFNDGLESFIAEKMNNFIRFSNSIKRFRDFLNTRTDNKGVKYQRYNLRDFGLLSRKKQIEILGISEGTRESRSDTAYMVQERINLLIGSYLDLISLLLPEQARKLELANQEMQKNINIYNGSLEKLDEYLKKFDKLIMFIKKSMKNEFNSIEDTTRDSKRSNLKNQKKNFIFKLKSPTIDLIKEGKNPLSYLQETTNLGKERFPIVETINAKTISNNIVLPSYFTPDFNKFVLDGMKSYENLIILDNQKNKISNFGVKRDYIPSSDLYNNKELESMDRIYDSLSYYGIRIAPINEEDYGTEISNKTITQKINPTSINGSSILGSTNLFNTVLTSSNVYYENQENIVNLEKNKLLDFNEEIGYIAANMIIGEIKNTSKNKIAETNLSEYAINNCLNGNIQYLSGYDINYDNVNLFKERWVSINQVNSNLLSQGNLLCRVHDFDSNILDIKIRKKLNVLKLYETFIYGSLNRIKQDSISSQSTDIQRSILNSSISLEFSSLEDEALTVMNGLDGLFQGARRYIYYNKVFSHNYIIEQPISVKVFGTNFGNTKKQELRTKTGMPLENLTSSATGSSSMQTGSMTSVGGIANTSRLSINQSTTMANQIITQRNTSGGSY